MAVLATNMNGHIQSQLTRSLERILEDAHLSGELKLSGRKLKEFPKASSKYNLSDTVIADLSKNRFSELPEEITTFPFLERLHVYHNIIRSIPDAISGLQCLSHLDLSRNQLTTLPREICQLPLQVLIVSNNRLIALPDELGRMPLLTELDASCNQLTHLPPHMSDLPHIKSLLLRSNLLLCIPVEVTSLRLVRLDIRSNRIAQLPLQLRLMKTLIHLLVDDNPLTSPPASLCRRGRVHIFKYLEIESMKVEHKRAGTAASLLNDGSRRTRRSNTPPAGGPPSHLPDRFRHKRHNVDSGYSSTSDGFDKRWSQEVLSEPEHHHNGGGYTHTQKWTRIESTPLPIRTVELNNGSSTSGISTPSTISPGADCHLEQEMANINLEEQCLENHDNNSSSGRLSPTLDHGTGIEDKGGRPLHQIQTYREYKEALRQQRAADVPAIYRPKDDQNDDEKYKTEPCTPTHNNECCTHHLASSKSDPTPLNTVLKSSPKQQQIFDETSPKRPVQKVTPSRFSPTHVNGTSKYIHDYVKPKSPVKHSGPTLLSHDKLPVCTNGKATKPNNNGTLKTNGVKRNISWNRDIPPDKLSFTMRREFDKAKEESDLIDQLRNIIETRLKMALPDDLAPALTDGVVLCHLANHVRPRSVASIHVPSPAVPKLTMARCRRNVDNFLEACRKIGVEEGQLCSSVDITEGLITGSGILRLLGTIQTLCDQNEAHQQLIEERNIQHEQDDAGFKSTTTTVSTILLLTLFFGIIAFFIKYPLPN